MTQSSVGYIVKTYGNHTFVIDGWSLLSKDTNGKISSPEFKVKELPGSWRLDVYPYGSPSTQIQGSVSVSITHCSDEDCVASFSFFVECMDVPKEVKSQRTDPLRFDADNETYELTDFLLPDGSGSPSIGEFLVNDTITFGVDVCVYGNFEIIPCPCPIAFEMTAPDLSTDLRIFYFSEQEQPSIFSDIVLTTSSNSAKFHCHKTILAARSSILKRKFTSKNFPFKMLFSQGQYKLDDIDGNVLREVLVFLYSDKCSDSGLSVYALPLLAAAKRFEIKGLAEACELYLMQTLLPHNVVERYMTAQRECAYTLEISCLAFMAIHLEDVMRTPAFEQLDAATCRRLLSLGEVPKADVVDHLHQHAMQLIDAETSSRLLQLTKLPAQVTDQFRFKTASREGASVVASVLPPQVQGRKSSLAEDFTETGAADVGKVIAAGVNMQDMPEETKESRVIE